MTDRPWINTCFLGDSSNMRELPDGIIDALVTDPPAGIGFMGKAWDQPNGIASPNREPWADDRTGKSRSPFARSSGANGDRADFMSRLLPIFSECLRVLKPGAHGLVWALPRTSHWTATALEDAGFEVRDVVMHLFGSGFPKSMNVSVAIDKHLGNERRVGDREGSVPRAAPAYDTGELNGYNAPGYVPPAYGEPISEAARAFDGWGTALKPAAEHWILIRKPIATKNIAANVLEHGTGALNIDASRIGTNGEAFSTPQSDPAKRRGLVGISAATSARFASAQRESIERTATLGRWPAHVVLSHNTDCEQIGTRKVKGSFTGATPDEWRGNAFAAGGLGGSRPARGVGDENGEEEVPVYRCTAGCAVAELDAQSGVRASGDPGDAVREDVGYRGGGSPTSLTGYGDTGGASRFFFVAKPASSEKNAGVESRNTHPTVKPVDLMCYLIRLITPPGGIVLDPFAGSGTTLVAAEAMGFQYVGYEREAEYHAIIQARTRQIGLFS